MHTSDVIVIGAGMAGASAAALLAEHMQVLVLEAESHPGYHTTGRSAATFIENYGAESVRAMTRASREFLHSPPDGFADGPLMSARGLVYAATAAELDLLAAELAAAAGMERLTLDECTRLVPALAGGPVVAAGYESGAQDMDVDRIHQGFVRLLKRRGGQVICDARVQCVVRRDGLWQVHDGAQTYAAPVLVNAAGAWGDVIASLAGVRGLGLQPLRRSVAIVEVTGAVAVDPAWPLVAGVAGNWYCKPEQSWLLVSPADETPSEPCDAYPQDLDLALGIDRMQTVLQFEVKRMHRSWAGLRTFAPDRLLVNGFDPLHDGFYWLVGQGGYGIQTGPAMAAVAACNISGSTPPGAIVEADVDVDSLSPARFTAR
jgi:D-arginine dehydrogenase